MYSSLYVHVPFCSAKCAYCAFYSIPDLSCKAEYINGLVREMARFSKDCRPLDSIFIGGGTPSILSVDDWKRINDAISKNFELSDGCEWSVEANPESLTPELVSLWASFGINRISLGVQAPQEHLRKTIGRNGSLDKMPELVEAIHGAGISRLNLDLIYNIPGQSREDWRQALQYALSFKPTHVSAYSLTLEEGTRLANEIPQLSDDEFLGFWDDTDEILGQQGIRRYEISNFALPGEECRHNYTIWHGATYLGCGPAAASFDGTDRRCNVSSVEKWLAGASPEMDHISPEERASEILATGLRCVNGWAFDEFQETTGFDCLELRGTELRHLQKLGMVEMDDCSVRPTRQGLLFNDNLAMEIL